MTQNSQILIDSRVITRYIGGSDEDRKLLESLFPEIGLYVLERAFLQRMTHGLLSTPTSSKTYFISMGNKKMAEILVKIIDEPKLY